jgi:hypothetical protein
MIECSAPTPARSRRCMVQCSFRGIGAIPRAARADALSLWLVHFPAGMTIRAARGERFVRDAFVSFQLRVAHAGSGWARVSHRGRTRVRGQGVAGRLRDDVRAGQHFAAAGAAVAEPCAQASPE